MQVKSTGILVLGAFICTGLGAAQGKAACSDPPAPKVDWGGCDKRHADLRGADLRGANLTYTDFLGANLEMANLSEARMWATYLWEASLYGANLRNADILGAYLSNAYLERAVWVDGRICGPDSMGRCDLGEDGD